MKTYLRLFSLIAVAFLPIALWANVIVKGHLYYNNGQPVANYAVHIETDSISGICRISHVKYTNASGVYQDTLICTSKIERVRVWVLDCHNNIISNYLPVSTANLVEANFTVCVNEPCHAAFTFTPDNSTGFYFNAAPSTTSTGDNIIQYRWKFGDGTTATTKDPHHIYTKAGSYNVCLSIVSASGCTDSICKTIVVQPSHCHAQFTYLPTNITGTLHFNGQSSTGDSVIRYSWTFGDGTTATTKDPYHTYTKAGVYMVCLTIGTLNGCTDSTCVNINVAAPPPTTCSANFTFTDTGLNVHFNSIKVSVSAGDTIINRYWSFGDGQTLSGNVVAPVHHYQYGGNYQSCLKITTKYGCASEYCTTVHISGDSIPAPADLVKIISIYPNPATSQFNTNIYSRYSNVNATLAIYDVYGAIKWSTQKVLAQGINAVIVPVSQLTSGPYIFKVTTIYGISSMRFFKL